MVIYEINMKQFFRNASIMTIFCLIALVIMAGVYLPGGVELRVTPLSGKTPLLVLPLRIEENFTIHYYHSVENTPIWEVHSIDKNGLIYIEEEIYLKFGAGMGKMPGVGHMVTRGPYEAVEGMHMLIGDFVLRIGSPGVDHTVLWRDTYTNLSKIAPHTAVKFSARSVAWFYHIWRNYFPHTATPPDKEYKQ